MPDDWEPVKVTTGPADWEPVADDWEPVGAGAPKPIATAPPKLSVPSPDDMLFRTPTRLQPLAEMQGLAGARTEPSANLKEGPLAAQMTALHIPAQGLDEIAGLLMGRTQEPGAPGGTSPGAAGALLRKALVLSPIAFPGHAARAAEALHIPGGGFLRGGMEAIEEAGSTLATDPSMALIPEHAAAAAAFIPDAAESLGISAGELYAELEKNGWKPTPELGKKLGKTGVGAAFLLMLGHGVYEGVPKSAAALPKPEHLAPAAEPLKALQEAGVTGDTKLPEIPEAGFTDNRGDYQTETVSGLGTLFNAAVAKGEAPQKLRLGSEVVPGFEPGSRIVLRRDSAGEPQAAALIRPDGVVSDLAAINLGSPAAGRVLHGLMELDARVPADAAKVSPDTMKVVGEALKEFGISYDELAKTGLRDLLFKREVARAERAELGRDVAEGGPGARAEAGAAAERVGAGARPEAGEPLAAGAEADALGAGSGVAPTVPPRPEGLGAEAGALLTKTPEQPVAPIPGYDKILEARAGAKEQPGVLQRVKEFLSPRNLKAQLLTEEEPIFAKADEVAQAMGVPGKFDPETSPIPKDPRLMLPLLKNVGALARHDSIVLSRVQEAARSEGLLGYVTQYLDLLGGERRMKQSEQTLVQKQREATLHGLASIIKKRTGSALGTESRLTNQLTTGQRPKMFKRAAGPMSIKERMDLAFKTLPRVRERLGSLYAGERAAGKQTPAVNQALEGKFVKARKQAAALQAQLHGKEVHPLFTSSADVHQAFQDFEAAVPPQQLQRVQELSAYVLDLHRRNLEMAFRPSARFGGSANGLLNDAQFNELKGRTVGPEGTEYAPLNRLLDRVEGQTGWTGGAGLTSQQRTWLQKYKTGSKNAPVDPFDAALASSMRLFSDLSHNAAADSIYNLGVQGKKLGVDVGVRKLKGDEKPARDEIALAVRKKGETVRFAVPAEFAPALIAKGAPELNGITMGTLRRARNLLREGVINLYPFFAVSNVPVDFADAMLLGRVHTTKLNKYNPVKYLVGAAHWVAALKQTMVESPEYMEALWHGALGSTFTHAARAERGASPLPGAPKGIGGAIRGALEAVGQKTEETTKVFGFQESLRRLKELEATGRKTTNPKELLAAYEAMKFVGTPDVLTHGKAIPEANVIFPFLNVGIQGTARMYRRFINNPKEFLLPTLATITATEAMLLAWNAKHDDGEGGRELDHVPQDEKDNYWSVILPESQFGRYPENGRLHRLKIRKPQPIRIFAGPIRDLLAGAFTATNPDYLQTGLNSLTEAQPIPGLHVDPNKPVSSIAKSLGAAQNPLVKLTLEQISNQDFLRGTPIERQAEAARAPSERYDERTSPTAVVLSQLITKGASMIDRARGGMTDSSGLPRELLQDVVPGPKRIEHGVRTLTGGLGQMAMGIMDPIAAKFSPQPPRAREPVEQIPVLNDLLRRLVTLAPRDAVREKLTDAFYDRYDQVDEVVKTFPVLMRTNPARAQEFLQERGISDFGQVRGEYVAMVNASAALARLYKEARAAKTSGDARRVNDTINSLLKQVLAERRRRSSASTTVPQMSLPSPSTMPVPPPEIDDGGGDYVAPQS